MNPMGNREERAKWEELQSKADDFAENDTTFSVENMRKFQRDVNAFVERNPQYRVFEGLTEVEHYAVRKFYYYNCH